MQGGKMRTYEIVQTVVIAERIKAFKLYAPLVTKHCEPGQFLIVMVHEQGERIPLTIADFDRDRGLVEIVFQEVGKSTIQLGAMKAGECLHAVAGPLGHASEIAGYKDVVAVGGGIGVAPVFPIARGCKKNGARVTSIIGARTRSLLIYEEKMRDISDDLVICTDDGSYGRRAVVTEPLRELLEKSRDIDLCLAIGPAMMMKSVAETTRPFGVRTLVSLNSIMIDGTGMCGGCRVSVSGKTYFACVDGPEFDGHEVDFELLMARQGMYRDQEREAVDDASHPCRIGLPQRKPDSPTQR
jgi:ferredoxin--NADP+ reductase